MTGLITIEDRYGENKEGQKPSKKIHDSELVLNADLTRNPLHCRQLSKHTLDQK